MDLINIKSPADLKGLSISELTDLTVQARRALMAKVSEQGVMLALLWGQQK